MICPEGLGEGKLLATMRQSSAAQLLVFLTPLVFLRLIGCCVP